MHSRIHGGEKMWYCRVCGKACIQHSHLHELVRVKARDKLYKYVFIVYLGEYKFQPVL